MLFLRFYNWEAHKETEPSAVSPRIIKASVSSFAILFLPISLLFLFHNDDEWTKPAMSWGLVVYIMILGVFLTILTVALTLGFGPAQFVYQIQLILSTRSRRNLSALSTAFFSVLFIALAVLLFLRSWPNLDLRWRDNLATGSQFMNKYGQLSLPLGYLVAGLGNVILSVLCLRFDWHDVIWRRPGPVHLE